MVECAAVACHDHAVDDATFQANYLQQCSLGFLRALCPVRMSAAVRNRDDVVRVE
jgi:hypothetical protein